MEEVKKTAGVLIFDPKLKQVLLVKNTKKSGFNSEVYGLPAGRVEENEELVTCAQRELLEETGYLTTENNLKPLPTTYYAEVSRKDGKQLYSYNVFLCDSYSGDLIKGEETEPMWILLSQISTLNLLPNIKEIITEGLKLKEI